MRLSKRKRSPDENLTQIRANLSLNIINWAPKSVNTSQRGERSQAWAPRICQVRTDKAGMSLTFCMNYKLLPPKSNR